MKKIVFLLLFMFTALSSGLFAQDFSELYAKVLPAVCKISVDEKVVDPSSGRTALESGTGSGVLIDAEGHILTAAHVIQTANKVKVEFSDGTVSPADIIYSVPLADVALIKLVYKPKDRPYVKLADSDLVKIGSQVIMVGAPYELDFSLSVGYISGRRIEQQFTNGLPWVEYFQTDASINKGNSGGPMFNVDGEVIGIASYILSESGGFQGLGFAATSNICKNLLLEGKNPWTGLEAKPVSGTLARILNLPQESGLLVQKVVSLSPADFLGLKGGKYSIEVEGEQVLLGGDIILQVNDIKIEDEQSIEDILLLMQKAKALKIKVLRGGEIEVLEGEL